MYLRTTFLFGKVLRGKVVGSQGQRRSPTVLADAPSLVPRKIPWRSQGQRRPGKRPQPRPPKNPLAEPRAKKARQTPPASSPEKSLGGAKGKEDHQPSAKAGAGSRTRTDTLLREGAFETPESTDFSIPAMRSGNTRRLAHISQQSRAQISPAMKTPCER